MGHFTKLRHQLETYLDKEQVEEVYQAYLLAAKAHKGQRRRTGDPYIAHPVAVARILADMRLDMQSIIAAILHDVIEDTSIDKSSVASRFGEQVAELVDGVTKLTQIKFESKAEAQAEYFRKMVLAMARDIRVILVKLADRLHNMRTLGALNPSKRRRIAKETLEIYAPIASRLGMYNFRVEFEDLGFAAYHPTRYRVLSQAVKKARGNRREILKIIEQALREGVGSHGIAADAISGREKHLYSIYKKMRNKRLSFSEVMDVYGFRVVVDSIDTCYRVLGMVHQIYKPVPERFKDYIAIPKANGYQSLHTTLFGPYGVPIEIQIRTQEMHNMAENGIAAHWLYKDSVGASEAQVRAREWLTRLLEMQQSTGNSLEFIESVKIDLFPDEVYVFTPKGDIMELPTGATAVDFAYAVHSDVGNTCVAAKIDKRLAPLSTQLSNGQTVEVVSAPGARPNPAWLNFVVTGKARSNIRHYLKSQRRTESTTLGQRLIEEMLSYYSKTIDDIAGENLAKVLVEAGFNNIEELYESTGLGNQMPMVIARRLLGYDEDVAATELERSSDAPPAPLVVRGSEGLVVSIASCCRPIPGDPIVGVLQPGRGLEIHVDDCPKVAEIRHNPDKCVPARWEEDVKGEFEVDLRLSVVNQRGVLASIAAAIADAESNIDDIRVGQRDERYSLVDITLAVRDRTHLARIMRRVRRMKVVNKISRI